MTASSPFLSRIKNPDQLQYEYHTITTLDGLELSLRRVYRSTDTPAVLLIHGLSSSSEMHSVGETYDLTSYLLDHGMEDVWLLDWRSSNEYKEHNYNADHNIDQVAFYDFPPAVEFIQDRTSNGLHVIAHCIGSMAFSISLATQKVKNLRSCILANVSLYPKLPASSLFKLYSMPQFAKSILDLDHFVVDPEAIDYQDGSMVLMQATSLGSNACEHPGCRMLSMIWGGGHPDTLFNHENLLPETHDRIHDFLGPVSLTYFRHIQKMLHHNAVVSCDGKTNYLDLAANIKSPIMLAVGTKNYCWYDSIQHLHELLNTFFGEVDQELMEVPNYGHMDLFMGKNAWSDVFPGFVKFLKKH